MYSWFCAGVSGARRVERVVEFDEADGRSPPRVLGVRAVDRFVVNIVAQPRFSWRGAPMICGICS
jgi:hypothetical protein